MAILNRKIFLPDSALLEFLTDANVRRALCPDAGSDLDGMLILDADNGRQIILSSDYRNVEFKFEVFYIVSRIDISPGDLSRYTEICFPESIRIGLLFQAAWLRPANPGEVPSQYEPIVEEQGNIKLIPDVASSVGIYLKGISFETVGNESFAVMAVNDDNPLTLSLYTEEQYIKEIKNKCEYVPLLQINEWVTNLKTDGWIIPS